MPTGRGFRSTSAAGLRFERPPRFVSSTKRPPNPKKNAQHLLRKSSPTTGPSSIATCAVAWRAKARRYTILEVLEAERLVDTVKLRNALIREAAKLLPEAIRQAKPKGGRKRKDGTRTPARAGSAPRSSASSRASPCATCASTARSSSGFTPLCCRGTACRAHRTAPAWTPLRVPIQESIWDEKKL